MLDGSVDFRVPRPTAELLTSATTQGAEESRWKQRHLVRMYLVDAAVISGALALAFFGRFHLLATDGSQADADSGRALILSVLLAVAWFAALGLLQSRDISLVGVGSEEYRRVVSATMWAFGLVAVSALILQTPISRGYLLIALTVGGFGLFTGRHLLRRSLAKQRARGESTTHVLVLGQPDSIEMLCDTFSRSASAGYKVIGVCIPDFTGSPDHLLETSACAIPILGDENSVELALRLTGADALAVTAVEHLGDEKMKELAWQLDSLGVDMIVVPGMTDIAGPRLKVRPIDNLPLFHIARPRHDGPSAIGKRIFDIVFALFATLALLPVMVVVALAIRLHDGGPVFYRQVRVGQHGKPFRIFKFRTMVVNADALKDAEQAAGTARDEADGVFFKSASDSRITRIGRFLRAASIDELPQLFNVLDGSMSIVGPRPLVPGEGKSVDHFLQRRALVKPGMTGLWQVSGRSDVSDEERIRLDHSYVDNWSSVQDLNIVWRTVHAVLKRDGAY